MDSNIPCSNTNPQSDGVDEISVENVVSSTDDNQVNDTHTDDCVSDHVSSTNDCASDEHDLPLPPTTVDEDTESGYDSGVDDETSNLSTVFDSDEIMVIVIDSDHSCDECYDWGE